MVSTRIYARTVYVEEKSVTTAPLEANFGVGAFDNRRERKNNAERRLL